MPEEIDVEQLVQRAYFEKQVHRLCGRDGNAERLLGRLIGLSRPTSGAGAWGGIVVDTSGFAANSVARVNAALEGLRLTGDALLELHDLVLGLPDFYVERAGEALDFVVWDHETAVQAGHRIDTGDGVPTIVKVRRRGGRRAGAEDLLPDGPRRPVSAIVTSALLVRHGQDRSRPVIADVVEIGQRPIYEGRDKRAVRHEPIYETSLAAVALDRAVYAVWHAALGMLADKLARLPDYRVTGPAAPVAPWEAPALELQPSPAGDSLLDMLGHALEPAAIEAAERPRKRARAVR